MKLNITLKDMLDLMDIFYCFNCKEHTTFNRVESNIYECNKCKNRLTIKRKRGKR